MKGVGMGVGMILSNNSIQVCYQERLVKPFKDLKPLSYKVWWLR